MVPQTQPCEKRRGSPVSRVVINVKKWEKNYTPTKLLPNEATAKMSPPSSCSSKTELHRGAVVQLAETTSLRVSMDMSQKETFCLR
ncbi:hypothetical protein Y032_0140g2200 [Ancylostoma ceylanicum]|uniref:Uncharacterized protein n=1 Tax=Ancylostoma ceylanicum TaxID=53326 RepID=A0A016T4R0_9BILA|nr:hypothetical protein Y032_0140g2200 [Ancylostoma ceylanicum]